MTRHELASFALKLLGIYAIIELLPLIQFLGGMLGMLRLPQGRDMAGFWMLTGLLPLVLTALAGILLLVYSRDLAPLLMGEEKPLALPSVLTSDDVQAIGFSVVAVLIFLKAVPQLVQVIVNGLYLASRSPSDRVSAMTLRGLWPASLSGGIQVVLAIILFLQARGLVNLWHRIQTGRSVKPGAAMPGDPDGGG